MISFAFHDRPARPVARILRTYRVGRTTGVLYALAGGTRGTTILRHSDGSRAGHALRRLGFSVESGEYTNPRGDIVRSTTGRAA